jgi:biopolymer transport protein ExbB/biopolymer transport protein TolQ
MLIQKVLGVTQQIGAVVLYLLMALSVLSIGIIIERWWYFRKRRVNVDKLGKELQKKLRADDIEGAKALLRAEPSVEAAVILEALAWYEDGPDAFQEILAGALREKRAEFESGLLFLGTLGNNAPFIGLFGTVLGIVSSFKELGSATTQGMNNVMSGIAEALVATAIGILVALPAVVSYNVFQKKTLVLEDNVATLGNYVVALLKSTREEGLNETSARREPKIHAVAAGES